MTTTTTTKPKLNGTSLRNVGIILFSLGLLLSLISTILLVTTANSLAKSGVSGDRAVALTDGQGKVTLKKGETAIIMEQQPQNSAAKCKVTDPEGKDAPMEGVGNDFQTQGMKPVGSIKFSTEGDYSINCQGGNQLAAVPLSKELMAGAGKAVGGLAGLGLGGFLTLLGLILWIVGALNRGKAKRQLQEQQAQQQWAAQPTHPAPTSTPYTSQPTHPAAPAHPAGPAHPEQQPGGTGYTPAPYTAPDGAGHQPTNTDHQGGHTAS